MSVVLIAWGFLKASLFTFDITLRKPKMLFACHLTCSRAKNYLQNHPLRFYGNPTVFSLCLEVCLLGLQSVIIDTWFYRTTCNGRTPLIFHPNVIDNDSRRVFVSCFSFSLFFLLFDFAFFSGKLIWFHSFREKTKYQRKTLLILSVKVFVIVINVCRCSDYSVLVKLEEISKFNCHRILTQKNFTTLKVIWNVV